VLKNRVTCLNGRATAGITLWALKTFLTKCFDIFDLPSHGPNWGIRLIDTGVTVGKAGKFIRHIGYYGIMRVEMQEENAKMFMKTGRSRRICCAGAKR
jgi:hypothetical protein